MTKEFIISLVVIEFIENPWIQIIPLIGLSVIMAIGLLKSKPLRDKRENFFICIVEFFYILILAGFIISPSFGGQMSQYMRYNIYGYTLIALLSIVILIHIIYGIIISIETIRETYRVVKLWCNRNKVNSGAEKDLVDLNQNDKVSKTLKINTEKMNASEESFSGLINMPESSYKKG